MTVPIIDVWNTASFDNRLIETLRQEETLIRNYLITDRRQLLERDASDHRGVPSENPYGRAYQAFVDDVGRQMQKRTIRAWHYTRLVDDEVSTIRQTGVHISTLVSLRHRLDERVKAGDFSAEVADALYRASPFHHQPRERSGKFWMTSNPTPVDDGGVEPLLGNWGGEATYFWLEDEELEGIVAGIGKSRVLEIAVPVASTDDWYWAGRAVLMAFAQQLGLPNERGGFDLHAKTDLPASAVLAIHTAGEKNFNNLARGYPVEFSTAAYN